MLVFDCEEKHFIHTPIERKMSQSVHRAPYFNVFYLFLNKKIRINKPFCFIIIYLPLFFLLLTGEMDTLCIHHHHDGLSDEEAKLWFDGVIPPIYLSNGENPSLNPTRQALEQSLTILDQAKQPTLTFASGMAAATSVCLTLLKKDDHAVIVDDAYSGTTNLFKYSIQLNLYLVLFDFFKGMFESLVDSFIVY